MSAQETTPEKKTGPSKFDEFGRVGHCDLTARLDNLAIQLQNTPGSVAHIISYGPEGEGVGTGRALLVLLKDYLVNSRGMQADQINTIYGGRNTILNEPKIELWIAPRGAQPPEPRKHETNIDTFNGLFADAKAWDDVEFNYEDEMGPGIGLATDAAFADMLQQQNKAVAYIVTYNGAEATPGAWRRVAQREVEALNSYKLEAGRFKIIYGGTREETSVQLWILPSEAPPPVSDAGAEAPPAKNIKIASLDDYTLGWAQNERAVFTRLVEVLRDHTTLVACVIVRLQNRTTEPDLEGPGAVADYSKPEDPVEPEVEEMSADLPQLVEKWRLELANTHKIREDRFIVLFTSAAEDEGNFIDAWVVPPGQPLPDPNARDEEEPADEDKNPTMIKTNLQPPAQEVEAHSAGQKFEPQSLSSTLPEETSKSRLAQVVGKLP